MVLFKCNIYHRPTLQRSIYIPLWSYSNLIQILHHQSDVQNLHSTMVLFKSHWLLNYQLLSQIYIPLWSYSNLIYRHTYDAILLQFTFHYGPIQMICLLMLLMNITNLHSTMVLFKSMKTEKGRLKYEFTFHYGPIQILSVKKAIPSLMSFTFHYGPIQIKIGNEKCVYAV